MATVTISSDFGAQKVKSDTVSTVSPSISHEVMDQIAMILVFWVLSFKPTFSLSSFIVMKRFFSSSLLSAICVVSSAYLRLLIFLPTILIPACASFSPAFLMMYSVAAAKSLQSCPTLCDPIDGSPSASPFLRFCRQEHWSGLPFPSPMHENEKWKWSHSVVPNS